jgi:pimeloyl-ACP methyl ester carboxylesterase
MEYLHIGQADLFGFSNGGTIALQVAIRHPRVVRKLVVHRGSLSATAAIRSSGTRWQTCS